MHQHGSTSDTDVFFTILGPSAGPSDILFADLVALPGVPHPIPFRTRSLSPPGPMVLRLKARESRSPPGPPKGYQTKVLEPSLTINKHPDAGWSSPVARQAHNLKVTGSNPVPAPKGHRIARPPLGGFFAFGVPAHFTGAGGPRRVGPAPCGRLGAVRRYRHGARHGRR